MKRIGFPTDFSEFNLNALPSAVHLAQLLGSELHLIHVVRGGSFFSLTRSYEDFIASLDAAAEARLEAVKASAVEAGLSAEQIHCVVLNGQTADQVDSYCHANQVELLVLPTHGEDALRRVFIGSNASRLLKKTALPILTVNPHVIGKELTEIDHVLFPTDLSEDSTRALPLAVEMASACEARLTLLHALPDMAELGGGVFGSEFATLHSHYEDVLKGMREDSRKELEQLGQGVDGPEMVIEQTEGITAEEAIREFVEINPKTLIVMSTHGVRGLDRLIMGSVTERTIQTAHAPVLAVKPS